VINRIISGAQTGVDRAGLDAAIELGISHGGWCPKGRRANDGAIPPQYHVKETMSRDYPPRTLKNVLESTSTFIVKGPKWTPGTRLTVKYCVKSRKQFFLVDYDRIDEDAMVENFCCWVKMHGIVVLNVAGPSEEKIPGIQEKVKHYLVKCLKKLQQESGG